MGGYGARLALLWAHLSSLGFLHCQTISPGALSSDYRHHSLNDKPAWETSALMCGEDRLCEPLHPEITDSQNITLRYLGLKP